MPIDGEQLARTLHASGDAITAQTPEGRIFLWNRGAERMYGWSEAEALRSNFRRMVPDSERERNQALVRRAFNDDPVDDFETQRISRDKGLLDVWVSLTPVKDESGKVFAVAAIERDVTERRRAEAAMRNAWEQAEEARLVNSRFLATASHDLRQPLQSMSLLNAALLRLVDNEVARKMLLLQGDSITSMRGLLNALLDSSKLDSGQ